MPKADRRPRPSRRNQIESLEERLAMSADPLAEMLGGLVSPHAVEEDAAQPVQQAPEDTAPPVVPQGMPVESHGALEAHGALEPHGPLETHGALEPHGEVETHGALETHDTIDELPPLGQHVDAMPDFWLDDGVDQDDTLRGIEQTLASAHGQTGLNDVRNSYGFKGGGQTVAVIDSGIAYDHYALGGGFGSGYRVVGGVDLTEEADGDPYDDQSGSNSHGTHVAGIIGSSDSTHEGVAPEVDLVGLRVFNDAGAGYFSWVENALQWVIDNRTAFENPITAVNLSLGTNWNSATTPSWAMLEEEFAQLEADGVFISVSAGNRFTTYNSPGLSYPAASPYVVPVMSMDDSGMLSYFSQRHQTAIAAPGRSIYSTVSDTSGNNNGVADDWANKSGTSMAAPYVAGASVLIREAMEFVGMTNINQDTIYAHMLATADTINDAATGLAYSRLNLGAAIDALMPTDDYGSSEATAYGLGTITAGLSTASAMQMNGVISTLTDGDYFTFTAGSTGTVTFATSNATHDFAASWQGMGGSGAASSDGSSYTMNVAAGQTYTVALSSSNGLGYYNLSVSAEASFTYTDWGLVAGQQSRTNLTAGSEAWYRVIAGRDGIVTAQASYPSGTVNIGFYDANQNLLASGAGDRVDYTTTTGSEVYLRVEGSASGVGVTLTNLVNASGSAVTVYGTAGADAVSFTSGASSNTVSVGGVDYSFSTASTFTVVDGGGSDTLTLNGGSGNETFRLKDGYSQQIGAGYQLTAYGFENVTATGGGGVDRVEVYDSTGDDTLTAGLSTLRLTGAGYDLQASGFTSSVAYASTGNDTATLSDSTGSDFFAAWSDRAVFYGSGFTNDVRGFDAVTAVSSAGHDRAYLYDTTGDETYEATSTQAVMTGAGFTNTASGFDYTLAYATLGNDTAVLRDTSGDDYYSAWSTRAVLFGAGYFNDTFGFDSTVAHSTTGNDRATFYDTIGDDTYTAGAGRAVMSGAGYSNDARGFGYTLAFATDGNDTAVLNDSTADDSYAAWSGRVAMVGGGYFHDARNFNSTQAYSAAGSDRALLYDTTGDDSYTAWSNRSLMSGTGYSNEVNNFAATFAYASTGNDTATLYDSAGDDTYVGWKHRSVMYGAGFFNDTYGFDTVNARATGGGYDRGVVHSSAGSEQVHAEALGAYITDGSYRNDMQGFDHVYAYDQDGDGSTDSAHTAATDYAFSLVGDWS